MDEQTKKSGMNKGLIALGVIGGVLLLKKLFKKRQKPGYYESLGGKIDQGLENLTDKAEGLLHPKNKS